MWRGGGGGGEGKMCLMNGAVCWFVCLFVGCALLAQAQQQILEISR